MALTQGQFVVRGYRRFIESIKNYFNPYIENNQRSQITFNRQILKNQRINMFDLNKYMQDTNKKDDRFFYFFGFSLAFTLFYYIGLAMHDVDNRYWLYTRYPLQMQILDKKTEQFNKKFNEIKIKNIDPLQYNDVSTKSKFYLYKQQCMNFIFNIDEKQKIQDKIENEKSQEFQQSDLILQDYEQKLKEQDQKNFKKIQDNYLQQSKEKQL